MARPANRLAAETSPYLRQHARNPVDWYPWGPEALERARREDKPILLSIGYSACHWCHVMERESFENDDIAARMNHHFVNIKVDREERPDLDAIYMNAVQMMTGSGGWPLTAFLTPDGKPFFGGTYFPPEDRHGRPGFPRVLEAIARAYRESPDEVARTTQQILEGFARLSSFEPKPDALHADTVARGAERLLQHVDQDHGGIGSAPKFPNVPVFALLLRRYASTRRPEWIAAVRRTLTAMAHGGIYDHLGGGFHRYSVDAEWLVPHFEKMLYDNAQLVPLYLDALLATGEELYARVARETLDYVLREMTHPEGGFYSTQDADSEGEEGKFFVWRIEEIQRILGDADAALFCRRYGVDEHGNFAEPGHSEKKSILHVVLDVEPLARLFGRDVADVERSLASARERLRDVRSRRVPPARDEKILTSWNGLAIRAFTRAAAVLDEPAYLDAAARAAAFVDRELALPGGKLQRTWKDRVAKYAATLDDYADFAAAQLDLFESTGGRAHLERALELARILERDFHDPAAGGFFLTSSDHEALVDRPKTAYDGSTPAGNAVAAEVFLRLAHLTGDPSFRSIAEGTLRLFGAQLTAQPFGTATLLGVLDDLLGEPVEVAIVGPPNDATTRALVQTASCAFVPRKRVIACPSTAELGEALPEALRGKEAIAGRATAFVCRGATCSAPVHTPGELAALLLAEA